MFLWFVNDALSGLRKNMQQVPGESCMSFYSSESQIVNLKFVWSVQDRQKNRKEGGF